MLLLLLLQSCPTLCDPIDGSPSGSTIPGILQARTLEWVAISFSNVRKWKVKVKLLSLVRLSDPMDCSLPGSSVHGIFQARVLEWGAIAFSQWDTAKAVSRVKFIVIQVYFFLFEIRKISNNNLTYYLEDLEKEQIKPQISRKKK